jgi:hypothetical protein
LTVTALPFHASFIFPRVNYGDEKFLFYFLISECTKILNFDSKSFEVKAQFFMNYLFPLGLGLSFGKLRLLNFKVFVLLSLPLVIGLLKLLLARESSFLLGFRPFDREFGIII